uniref:Uncharacterized protein n=1 Tax=Lygus hesperus TaxID=30085 RepID=A0A146KWU7_LYGHE
MMNSPIRSESSTNGISSIGTTLPNVLVSTSSNNNKTPPNTTFFFSLFPGTKSPPSSDSLTFSHLQQQIYATTKGSLISSCSLPHSHSNPPPQFASTVSSNAPSSSLTARPPPPSSSNAVQSSASLLSRNIVLHTTTNAAATSASTTTNAVGTHCGAGGTSNVPGGILQSTQQVPMLPSAAVPSAVPSNSGTNSNSGSVSSSTS